MTTYILTQPGVPDCYCEAESVPPDLLALAEANGHLCAQLYVQDDYQTVEIFPGWRKAYLWTNRE